jgi:hypothetical protein
MIRRMMTRARGTADSRFRPKRLVQAAVLMLVIAALVTWGYPLVLSRGGPAGPVAVLGWLALAAVPLLLVAAIVRRLAR